MSLVVTAKKLLFAPLSSGHQKQMPETRLNINHFVFNSVRRSNSDVEVFTVPVGSNVDPSAVSAKGLADSHSRSHAFKHGF
jgi:hypothetical protein